MAIRQVLTTNTFEEQRQIINLIASDVGDFSTLSVTASSLTQAINSIVDGSLSIPNLTATNLNVTTITAGGSTGDPSYVLSSTPSGVRWVNPTSNIIIPPDSIGTTELKNNSVTTDKIIASGVTTDKIQDGAVTASKIALNSITADRLLDGTITSLKIAPSGITGDRLQDATITSQKIAPAGITTLNLADDSVTSQKINIVSSGIPSYSTPTEGKLYFEKIDKNLKLNDGTSWSNIITEKSRGTILRWINVSSSQTVEANKGYIVNTTQTSVTLTLPANPQMGDYIEFMDPSGAWDINNLTVIATPNTIKNPLNISDSTLIADIAFGAFNLLWTGTNWSLF